MRPIFMLSMLAMIACNPSLRSNADGSAVTLRVAPETVAAGDSVTLTLRNGSGETIGYNLCSSGLQRLVGGAWEAVPEDRVCTMELRTLEAGAEATYELRIGPEIQAGEYRYVTNVERLEQGTTGPVASDPFRVAAR